MKAYPTIAQKAADYRVENRGTRLALLMAWRFLSDIGPTEDPMGRQSVLDALQIALCAGGGNYD